MQLLEVLLSPCRAESANGLRDADALQPQHVGASLHQDELLRYPRHFYSVRQTEHTFLFLEDRRGARVHIFADVGIGTVVATGESTDLKPSVVDRDSHPVAEHGVT